MAKLGTSARKCRAGQVSSRREVPCPCLVVNQPGSLRKAPGKTSRRASTLQRDGWGWFWDAACLGPFLCLHSE